MCSDTDSHCASDESSQLVQLVLYIQGNSQTVFLLLMQQDSLSVLDVVKDLVRTLYYIVYFLLLKSICTDVAEIIWTVDS